MVSSFLYNLEVAKHRNTEAEVKKLRQQLVRVEKLARDVVKEAFVPGTTLPDRMTTEEVEVEAVRLFGLSTDQIRKLIRFYVKTTGRNAHEIDLPEPELLPPQFKVR